MILCPAHLTFTHTQMTLGALLGARTLRCGVPLAESVGQRCPGRCAVAGWEMGGPTRREVCCVASRSRVAWLTVPKEATSVLRWQGAELDQHPKCAWKWIFSSRISRYITTHPNAGPRPPCIFFLSFAAASGNSACAGILGDKGKKINNVLFNKCLLGSYYVQWALCQVQEITRNSIILSFEVLTPVKEAIQSATMRKGREEDAQRTVGAEAMRGVEDTAQKRRQGGSGTGMS